MLEHVAIELQNVAGATVTFGKTRSADAPGRYHVVFEYEQEEVGLEAARLALTLLHSLVPEELRPPRSVPEDFDFAEERDAFIRFAQRRALGPSTASLVHAGEDRGIPWMRLNDASLIQFGWGRYQQRVQATITSHTNHIAVEIASDKEETNKILSRLGLPVPRQRLVQREEEAIDAARRIGYPVVVKPYNANHGRGVAINLRDDEAVSVAFRQAQAISRSVIVETFIEGHDHRMLVINGELVAVAKRVPGHVVGDGSHTIEELVAIVNSDPRRGIGHEKVLTRIEFDSQADRLLAQLNYTRQTVPPAGEIVYLRSTGNLSTGGTSVDVTDAVHPDNREMAVRAVEAIGLDVGGVDFLTPDITQSYREEGGAICEVNAAPGFRMHMAPSEGTPRDVAGNVLDMLFPPGTPSRIPIAAITGTNGKTTTSRMLAHIHKLAGRTVGLTTTDGVYIDGNRTVEGDMTGPIAARMVLGDPQVDVAVLETARGGLLRAGMGYRHCDVAACLNVKSDHLGLRGVETLEELAKVKRIPIEVARDTAVLNADDPLCLAMADYTEAKVICYVTLNPEHPLVREHIRAGGRALALEAGVNGQMITIYDKGAHIPLLWTHLIPATLEGRGHAQRAERDVRGGDGVQHGRQARGHPPRPPHLRHQLLPGPGPDERLRRARVQGHPRLRPQPGRGGGDVPADRPDRGQGQEAGGARRTGRPAGRRPPGDRPAGRRAVRALLLPPGRLAARAHRRGGAAHPPRGAARGRRAGQEDHHHRGRTAGGGRRAPDGEARRPAARLRRFDRADLEADHPLQARRKRQEHGRARRPPRPSSLPRPHRVQSCRTGSISFAMRAACGWPARPTTDGPAGHREGFPPPDRPQPGDRAAQARCWRSSSRTPPPPTRSGPGRMRRDWRSTRSDGPRRSWQRAGSPAGPASR